MAKLPKKIYVKEVFEDDGVCLEAGKTPAEIIEDDVDVTYAGEYILKKEVKILRMIIVEDK